MPAPWFIAGLVLLSFTASCQAADPATQQAPGVPSGPIPVEKLHADLDFLLATMEEVHPNLYAYVSKAEAKKTFDRVRAKVDRAMTCKDFCRLIAPAVASFKNGHTFVYPMLNEFQEYIRGGGRVFPIAIQFDRQAVILRDFYGEGTLPVGGEILTINGEKAMGVCQKYASYFAAEGRTANPAVIEQTKVLWALLWMDYGGDQDLELEIKSLDGKASTYTVKSVTFDKAKPRNDSASKERTSWEFRYLEDSRCGLITIQNLNGREAFEQFLQRTFRALDSKSASALIIDLRSCPGGDSRFGDALLDYLTDRPYRQMERMRIKISPQMFEKYGAQLKWNKNQLGSFWSMDLPPNQPKKNALRFRGRVIVLIGQGSFSSSTSFAACVKHYGIATLVGEETGDTTDLYGEGYNFRLPNSGLIISVACKHFVLAGGSSDGRGVIPDHEVKQTREDLVAGKDTALNYAIRLLGASPTSRAKPAIR